MRVSSISLAFLALGACRGDGATVVTDPPERLPSVDPSGAIPSAYSGEHGQSAVPCLVRYDFAAPDTDVDCTVEDTNGALAWSIVCPAHRFLPVRHDFTFDANGVMRTEAATYTADVQSWTADYGPITDDPACQSIQVDADNRPTQVRCIGPDTVYPDGSAVILGDRTSNYSYDAFGRILDINWGETAGRAVVDFQISYDDTARRRNYDVVQFPIAPWETEVHESYYDILDADMRLIERYRISLTNTYSYDESNRLVTTTEDFRDPNSWSYSFAEHRIYDCP